jgi:protein-tyrosine phosphatase
MEEGLQSGTKKDIPGAYMRDIGGWRACGGQVRNGLLYRSARLAELRGEGVAALTRLGIRSVYDLRTAEERTHTPDRVPPGVNYVVVDVLRDLPGLRPGELVNVLADPKAAESVLGGQQVTSAIEQGYRHVINLPSALTGYRRLFGDLAEPARMPALLHCTTGKDRTGWAVAALLLLLGVTEDDVYADYLLTNKQLLPAMRPIVDRFVAAGGEADLLAPVIGLLAEYLVISVDEMRQRFGSIEGYFYEGLGLDSHTDEHLRTTFVEYG